GVFDLKTGTATEIQLPDDTGPHNLALGPDGQLWFSGEFDKLGSLNIQTHQLHFFTDGISLRSKPDFLAFDPLHQNFIWFSEQLGSRLARFDMTASKTTEFNFPAINGIPQDQLFPHGTIFTSDGKSILIEITAASQIVKLDVSSPINSQADFNAHLSTL